MPDRQIAGLTCFCRGAFAEFAVSAFVAGALSALESSVAAGAFRRVSLFFLFALALALANRLQFNLSNEERNGEIEVHVLG